MRAMSIAVRWIAGLTLIASATCGGAIAEEPTRFPVPATAIYPGDLIKEEMIIDRAFAPNMPGAAAFVSETTDGRRSCRTANAAAGSAYPDQCP